MFGNGFSKYLNMKEVRDILHIPSDVGEYRSCSNLNYEIFFNATYWMYPTFKEYGLRVLHYSGDTDGAVATIGTEKWIRQLGWDEKSDYRPFYHKRKLIGYNQVYDGLEFTVLHGAGHVAPMWEPESSMIAVYSFIFEEELPFEFQ